MPNVSIKFGTYDFGETISNWERKQSVILDAAEIPRRDGQVIQGGKQGIREYTLSGHFQGDTPEAVRELYDDMMSIVANRTDKLYLLDDRFAECRLVDYSDSFVEGSALTVLDFILTFQSTLPYEQSDTLNSTQYTTTTTNPEAFAVVNAGNYPAFIKITITAPGTSIVADCTVSNVTSDDSFSYLGTIATTKSLIINGLNVPFTVHNDSVSDIANYSGVQLKLLAGSNTLRIDSSIGTVITVEHRDTYV